MDPVTARYQIALSGSVSLTGSMIWHMGSWLVRESDEDEGFLITFEVAPHTTLQRALKVLSNIVAAGKIDWLLEERTGWKLNLDRCFDQFSDLKPPPWLKGTVTPLIEVETHENTIFDKIKTQTTLRIWTSKREIILSQPQRIFLSHKGIDKPIVRQYFAVLRTIGFDVWLDEDAMVAGDSLERALLQGMKDSCAAIFFLTTNYADENYLATEINYAIAEKRKRGDLFSIIALLLVDDDGNRPRVPDLLQQFVWKEPTGPLQAIEEILKALPIAASEISLKKF